MISDLLERNIWTYSIVYLVNIPSQDALLIISGGVNCPHRYVNMLVCINIIVYIHSYAQATCKYVRTYVFRYISTYVWKISNRSD